MKVTIVDIREKFEALVSETENRESVADFATRAMVADDSGSLEMEPTSDSEKIWKAITYLSGVDLKETPDRYLHSVEDFVEYRKANKI